MQGRLATYHPTMRRQARERLLSGVAISLEVAWLLCAVGIAVWVVEVAGMDAGGKGVVGLAALIWLVPVGVVVGVDEFVVRRIRYGPAVPGRHKRGSSEPDQVRRLDQRLTRPSGESAKT